MSEQYSDSIFWIEVDKIKPNPFQPRHEFDPDKLQALADSIRQYGVLQPLVVTRQEVYHDDGSMGVEYELVAGERRWRASRLAGIREVPAIIKHGEESDKLKLEMAIIENLQREDLNPVDRARAFQQLTDQFGLKHHEVAKRVGKSREYVSNSIRIMALPEAMLEALVAGKISEGHTRPILMLCDRPEEQRTLFEEIMLKRMTVRDAERIARGIAFDKVRKKTAMIDPTIADTEQRLTEQLGTRVKIERKDVGGKVIIDFISADDLNAILELLNKKNEPVVAPEVEQAGLELAVSEIPKSEEVAALESTPDEDIYDLTNFSI